MNEDENRTGAQQRMRDAVELLGGRASKDAYIAEVHRLSVEDGGSPRLDVLEKTALRGPALRAAGLAKVKIDLNGVEDYQVWLQEDAQALNDTVGRITVGNGNGVAQMTVDTTASIGTVNVAGDVWFGITRRDPSDYPDSEQVQMITKPTGFVDPNEWLELMAIAFKKGYHHISEGPTGCGKTMAEKEFCYQAGIPLYRINCKDGLTWDDLLGYMTADENGTTFIDGLLTRAVRYGGIMYVDEMTSALPAVMTGLNAVMDSGKLVVPMTGETLTAHDDFRVAGSFNPGYAGTNELNQATARRFAGRFIYEYLDADLEVKVIQQQSGVGNPEVARELVTLANDLRTLQQQNDIEMDCGTATLVNCMGWLTDISLTRAVETSIIGQAIPDDRQQVRLACRQRLSDFDA